MNLLKKILTLIFVFMISLYSAQVISGQINRITLDNILEDLPDLWWEGGWDKTMELNQYINKNITDKQACARAQFWIACNYYADRDYERAVQEYETVISLYPKAWGECAKAQFEIGQVYLYRLYENETALEAYKKVLSDYPKCDVTTEAQRMVAYTYFKMGNNEAAKEEYTKVWTDHPKAKLEVTKAYWEMGEMFFKESMNEDLSSEQKKQKMKDALSSYKLAYRYCPADDVEVAEWIINSIIRTFRFMDGNAERANAFIRYQRSIKVSDNGQISMAQEKIYDPLSEF